MMLEHLEKNKNICPTQQILNRSKKTFLCLLVLSLINVLFLSCGSASYFVSSLSIPYYVLSVGCALGGKMPCEFYENMPVPQQNGIFVASVILSVSLLIAYGTLIILSKKYEKLFFLIAIMYGIDLLFLCMVTLLFGFNLDRAADLAVHVWVGSDIIKGLLAMKS